MWYVYVLLSLKDKRFYTGYTEELDSRLQQHMLGRVNSTRTRNPLKLVYYEASLGQGDALHREKYLKTTWGKRYLKNRLKRFLASIEG
jgi:putative endonuclease